MPYPINIHVLNATFGTRALHPSPENVVKVGKKCFFFSNLFLNRSEIQNRMTPGDPEAKHTNTFYRFKSIGTGHERVEKNIGLMQTV